MRAFEKSPAVLSWLPEMGLTDLEDFRGKDTCAMLLKNPIFCILTCRGLHKLLLTHETASNLE